MTALQDTSPGIPILVFLSPGVDLAANVEAMGKKLGFTTDTGIAMICLCDSPNAFLSSLSDQNERPRPSYIPSLLSKGCLKILQIKSPRTPVLCIPVRFMIIPATVTWMKKLGQASMLCRKIGISELGARPGGDCHEEA